METTPTRTRDRGFRNCCLTFVIIVVVVVILITVIFWKPIVPYELIYAGIRNGMTEKQVRSRYAPRAAAVSVDKAPVGNWNHDPVARRARNVLAIYGTGPWLTYVYYLDSRDRVIGKYRFLD